MTKDERIRELQLKRLALLEENGFQRTAKVIKAEREILLEIEKLQGGK